MGLNDERLNSYDLTDKRGGHDEDALQEKNETTNR